MTPRNVMYLVAGVVVATMVACVSLAGDSNSSPPSLLPESTPTPTASQDAESDRPSSKIVTLNVEGQSSEIELKLFYKETLPFTTYYPAKDFTPEMSSSAQGTEAWFYFSPKGKKDEQAYIYFFIPHESLSSTEMIQDWILGVQGILVQNEWELVDRTDIVSYNWAQEKLIYQQQPETEQEELILGSIYVGQKDGQAFYALTHYPAEYGDGFEPRLNIVLESLQFNE